MESEVRSKESRKYVISSLDDLVKVPVLSADVMLAMFVVKNIQQ